MAGIICDTTSHYQQPQLYSWTSWFCSSVNTILPVCLFAYPIASCHNKRVGRRNQTMIQTIRTRATVKPGGVIEVSDPSLPEGASAEVIVRIEDSPSQAKSSPSLPPIVSYF